jgi:hypothetical protein
MIGFNMSAAGDTVKSAAGTAGEGKVPEKETEGLNEEADVLLAPKLVGEEGQVGGWGRCTHPTAELFMQTSADNHKQWVRGRAKVEVGVEAREVAAGVGVQSVGWAAVDKEGQVGWGTGTHGIYS